ncbi:MAG TPA: serine--tRNA ligase, partial [Woeseiaceae bacterium]|nr:serine--tRNA ligase [Woeseiaceae bacterium]
MIDPRLLRQSAGEVAENLARRGFHFDVAEWRALEERRKVLQVETEALRNEKNTSAKAIGEAKRRGEDIEPLLASIRGLGDTLERSERDLGSVRRQLEAV